MNSFNKKNNKKKLLPFSQWDVKITFVPFEPRRKDEVYDVWVETWLRAERNKLAKRLGQKPGV